MINLKTLTLACLLVPTCVNAASVLISPIDPVIESDQNGASLWLENQDSKPVYMEIKAVRWEQRSGENGYAKQSEVTVSPPFALISPGKRQLIRLIKNQAAPAGQERAYRIFIDEIPQAANEEKGGASAGVNFQMRYSIPLFVYGTGLTASQEYAKAKGLASALPALSYRLTQGKIEVKNDGAVHARLSKLTNANGGVLIDGLVGYVLPHSNVAFPLPKGKNPAGGALQATVNSEREPVRLTPR